jgi:HSP20 family protein
MQELDQALKEVRGLHKKVLGRAAPELGPESFFPFPAGVDPVKHALRELESLRQLVEATAFAPRPDAWTPLADTYVAKGEFIVRLEVPGVSREDLTVVVVGRECIVRGERKSPQQVGDMRPVAIERPWGAFERRFVIPTGGRAEEMKARVTDGVLELRIPTEVVEHRKEHKVNVT